MSEEKKDFELKEKELEKVSGGTNGESYHTFNQDDKYKYQWTPLSYKLYTVKDDTVATNPDYTVQVFYELLSNSGNREGGGYYTVQKASSLLSYEKIN